MEIATILTCYNRKEKTISCLNYLFIALDYFNSKKKGNDRISLRVYLTDDGCSDGTAAAVMKEFEGRDIIILQGDGNLYWAGGMRNSWNEALKNEYDSYLLLNDDTYVSENLFGDLMFCDEYSMKNYNTKGIYVCSTHDGKYRRTYGGSVFKNKFLNTTKNLFPNGRIQTCEKGNANIMLVTKEVIEKIGILSKEYIHGVADYDYTLMAKKKKIPVLLAGNFCGICLRNNTNLNEKLIKLSFSERKNYLYHPLGLGLSDQITFMKKHLLYRLPFLYAGSFLKLLFPKLYIALNKLR